VILVIQIFRESHRKGNLKGGAWKPRRMPKSWDAKAGPAPQYLPGGEKKGGLAGKNKCKKRVRVREDERLRGGEKKFAIEIE